MCTNFEDLDQLIAEADLVTHYIWLKLPITRYVEYAKRRDLEGQPKLSPKPFLKHSVSKGLEPIEEVAISCDASEDEDKHTFINSATAPQKTRQFGDLPAKIRSRIWREAISSKLLLSPKYWLEGFPTRLKAPIIATLSEEARAIVHETGAYYRLIQPHSHQNSRTVPSHPSVSWFSPDRDFLLYPCPADKTTGVHTVAQHLVMENIGRFQPRELHELMKPLTNPEMFPALKTIQLASELVTADEKWSPGMIEEFFGPEHIIVVNFLDQDSVHRIGQKLLGLLNAHDGLYYDFKLAAACFEDPAYWAEIKFVFEEAWLNAKWKLPYTQIFWSERKWQLEIVPTAALEDPRTNHLFQGAVVDEQEDFRALDSQGYWYRDTPYAQGVLDRMPRLDPVFVFVRPEDPESMWRHGGPLRRADGWDDDFRWYDELIELYSEGACLLQ